MKLPFCCFCSPEPETNMDRSRQESDRQSYENLKIFSYNELRAATNGFSTSNKIGEGGFGSVFKGQLGNGDNVAVKVLSVDAESMKGEREFTSELVALSNIRHENLVRLEGCCIDGASRYLVYEYLEHNSLSHTLLGREQKRKKFNWETRRDISLGVARGLAFLHEEAEPHIVHRDIKASNVLVDHHFRAKVADFGLSKLLRDNRSYITTRVAGTLGYLAPEYAVSGRLTRKSDVYSFGVLLLEIISGRQVVISDLGQGEHYLVEKAWEVYKADNLVALVDSALEMNYPEEEAVRFLKVGLLCVQENVKLRPLMSTAIKMLINEIDIQDFEISQPGLVSDLMDIKLGRKIPSQSSITLSSTDSIIKSSPSF